MSPIPSPLPPTGRSCHSTCSHKELLLKSLSCMQGPDPFIPKFRKLLFKPTKKATYFLGLAGTSAAMGPRSRLLVLSPEQVPWSGQAGPWKQQRETACE